MCKRRVGLLGLVALLCWVPPTCGGDVLDGPIEYDNGYDPYGGGDNTGDSGNTWSGTYDACLDYFQAINYCNGNAGSSDYFVPEEACSDWQSFDDEGTTAWFECGADIYWLADCSYGAPDLGPCSWVG